MSSKEYQREWKKKNKEKFKEYNKRNYQKKRLEKIRKTSEYHKKNPNILKKSYKNYIRKYPEKYIAHQIIHSEIIKGNLENINKVKCSKCGKQAINYHHPDYSKPYLVIPLCKSCHNLVHEELTQKIKGEK